MSTSATHADTAPLEARQFDFWIGAWDVSWAGGGGTNTIRSILDGHVIEEQFRSNDRSLDGMSVSVYSPQLGQWQQTWVDNQGGYLDLAGGWDGARMILATTQARGGQPINLRMVFDNISPDQFDWSWERSEDAGQTWAQIWQIHYRRRHSA